MSYLFDPFAPSRPEGALEGYRGLSGATSTSSGCGPWPPSIAYNVSDLHPAFRPTLERLLQRMKDKGLDQFFYPVTGKRSLERQCRAICEGGSELKDPSRGAHTAGLAVDFHARTGPFFRHKYDVGLDRDTHTIVEYPPAHDLWQAFGKLLKEEFPELTWGGDWKARYRAKGFANDQIHLGFDPYHVQLKNYTRYLPDIGYWKCVGGRPVQRTDTAQAAVERAIEEEPGKTVGVPALLLGGAVAFWLLTRGGR